jgi:hypothetical protein
VAAESGTAAGSSTGVQRDAPDRRSQRRPSRERYVPPVAQQPPAPNAVRPSVTVTYAESSQAACRSHAVNHG